MFEYEDLHELKSMKGLFARPLNFMQKLNSQQNLKK